MEITGTGGPATGIRRRGYGVCVFVCLGGHVVSLRSVVIPSLLSDHDGLQNKK